MKTFLDILPDQETLLWLFIAALLFVGVRMLLKILGDGFGNSAGLPLSRDFPYERAEFLSPAERSFFGALDLALGSRYRIFTKVRLADLIKTRGRLGRRRYSAFNQISQKHVDFVLCDPTTFEVYAVVELDDASHHSSRQRETDQWKDSALRAAKIPVIRIPAAASYSTAQLVDRIDPKPALPSTPASF